MAAIDQIPEARTVVYNQMIFIPNQKRELALLEKNQGACLNLIYKFDFGKKVKVKRAKSIQTTSDSYLRK